MTELELTNRLSISFACGLALIVVGLGNVFLSRRSLLTHLLLGSTAAGLACGILGLLDFDLALPVMISLGLLSGYMFLSVGLVRRQILLLAQYFARPKIHWAGLALAGCACVAGGLIHYKMQFAQVSTRPMQEPIINPFAKPQIVQRQTKTDRGRLIQLQLPTNPNDQSLVSAELRWLQQTAYWDKVIHRKGPSNGSNCHGWLFADGRYIVPGSEVDTILDDHDYYPVDTPAVNDVVIYRDETTGTVLHSAIVRAILDDGTILVEGKWGFLGVFLHQVNDCGYGSHFGYYHTERGSHLLSGLDAVAE